MEGIKFTSQSAPDCFENGPLTLILKPGTYDFLAKRSGRDYESFFKIKSGKCLKLQLP
jgi:hypothetical protein